MGPDDWAKLLKETLPVKQIYEDGLQPGVKQMGKALGTVVGILNRWLLPIETKNEEARILFGTNMERYRRKMEEIPEEKVIQIPPDLGVPLLQKLSYITDETLAELFSELLVSASVDDRVHSAHPSFVHVISSLSPDEAILLSEIALDDDIPFFMIKYMTKDGLMESFDERLTGLERTCDFRFPQNVQIYLQNLVGLGILVCYDGRELLDKDYEFLLNMYKDRMEKERDNCTAGEYYDEIVIHKGHYKITDYGRLFFEACIWKSPCQSRDKSEVKCREAGTL